MPTLPLAAGEATGLSTQPTPPVTEQSGTDQPPRGGLGLLISTCGVVTHPVLPGLLQSGGPKLALVPGSVPSTGPGNRRMPSGRKPQPGAAGGKPGGKGGEGGVGGGMGGTGGEGGKGGLGGGAGGGAFRLP